MKHIVLGRRPVWLRSILILFLLSGVILSTNAQDPHLSIDLNKVTIKQFFDEIQRKTDYTFSYREGVLDNDRDVVVSAKNKSLSEILTSVLKPKGLSFSIQAKSIVVTRQTLAAQQSTVKGRVVNSSGEPLIGVTVYSKDNKRGVATDIDGNFSIRVGSGKTSLQFTYVGYKPETVPVKNRDFIAVTMEEDSHMLNEVVAVGYGVMRKSDLTGSVTRVGNDKIANTPTVRLDQALTGKVSGVHITNTTGEPGAATNILIRGGNSISASNEPLYVIDGFIGARDLNLIDPNDIESIEILKDAAATSIYGSRGANGVIIVTTKRGSEGRNDVTVNAYVGVQQIAKRLEMLNAREYAVMLNQQDVLSNQEPSIENPSVYGKGTDWQDEILRLAFMQNFQVAASGGNKDGRYYLSLSMFDQDGVIKNSGIRRYQTRLNLDRKMRHNINIGANFQFSYTQREPNLVSLGGFDYQSSALATPPTMNIYNEDGSYASDSPSRVVSNDIDNVVAQLNERKKQEKAASIYAGIFAEWEAIKDLKFKTFLGLNAGTNKTSEYKSSMLPTMRQNKIKGEAWINQGESYSILWENTVNYMKEVAKGHHITALLGYTLQTSRSEGLSLYGKNFTNDLLTWNNLADSETSTRLVGSSASEWAIISYLGRINYSALDRYLLTVTGRYDGSSRLGRDNRFAFFPSVAVAWRLSEEPFMKQFSNLDNLKIRASYGELGANFIDSYSFLSTAYGPIPSVFGENQIGQSSVMNGYVTKFAQENLTWEKSISKNVALEMAFLNNKISFTAEYFWKDNNDLLAPLLPLASSGQTIMTNGGDLPVFNSASVENKGFEFTVGYRNNWKDWSLDVTANISALRNKVKSLGEGVQPIKAEVMMSGSFNDRPTITKPGLPIGTFWGYVVEGFDNDGNFIFQDNNGSVNGVLTGKPDGKIDENDKTDIGNPHPDFTYGLNINVGYKNWDLTAFFQGTQGNDIFALMKYDWYFGGANSATLKDAFYNSWTPQNPNAEAPKLNSKNSSGINSLPSTFYVEDGSYFRCKNLQIGYSFNKKLLQKFHIESFRIYAGVQNLFTITKYPLYDPEVSSNVLFDRGVDGFWQAQESPHEATMNSRVYNLGVNLTF